MRSIERRQQLLWWFNTWFEHPRDAAEWEAFVREHAADDYESAYLQGLRDQRLHDLADLG